MTREDVREMWALIESKTDVHDREKLGLPLVKTGTPREWMTSILDNLVRLLDTEPCDRDHCPTNCSPNCHLTPTGAPNAKA